MCPHRSWFSSYQFVDGGIFLMGNNVPCKIVGVGSIKIKMFDNIVITLTKVRHVPKIEMKSIYFRVYRSRWSIERVQGHLDCYEGYEDWKPLQIGRNHSSK
jgi:hypothetical protein